MDLSSASSCASITLITHITEYMRHRHVYTTQGLQGIVSLALIAGASGCANLHKRKKSLAPRVNSSNSAHVALWKWSVHFQGFWISCRILISSNNRCVITSVYCVKCHREYAHTLCCVIITATFTLPFISSPLCVRHWACTIHLEVRLSNLMRIIQLLSGTTWTSTQSFWGSHRLFQWATCYTFCSPP